MALNQANYAKPVLVKNAFKNALKLHSGAFRTINCFDV
jgi:hypothetical protein